MKAYIYLWVTNGKSMKLETVLLATVNTNQENI